MNKHSISYNNLAAGVCWIIAFTLAITNAVYHRPGFDVSALGVVFGLIGGTLIIKGYIETQAYRVDKAFRLGQRLGSQDVDDDRDRLRVVE